MAKKKSDTIELWFPVKFKKGIKGVENDRYFKGFKGCCCECGKEIKKRSIYYYDVAEDIDDVGPKEEYLLCEKCAKKKIKVL